MNDENGRLRDPTKWLFGFRPLLLLAFMLIIVPSGSAAWWFSARDLSEKPPRSATSPEIPIASSSIAASATIAYSALTDALNKEVPTTFNADGRQKVCADLNEAVQQTVQKKIGGDVGKFVGKVAKTITQVITVNQVRHVCQDVDYKVTVTRTAPVTVSRSADKVHISTNVNISGQAGFSGDVARALAVDKKNFRGGVHAFADISADIDTNWCPHLQAVPGFNWTDKGQLEIVHNVWLGIEGQVGGKITDQMNAAVGRVIAYIKCEDIKAAVGKVWHPYSFPISLSNESKSAVFANLEPKSIGFSGFKYEDTALKLALEIDAITKVMTSPLPPGASAPLPPLQRIKETSDRLNITVPITASYDEVVVAAENFLKCQTFEADVASRHVKISVDDVAVYPSAEKLAIGMHFSASTGHQIFDTKGWVYVLAEPVLDQANQVLGLRNVTYTRQLDNELWSVLSAVFDTKIRKVIQDNATYDLKPRIAELRTKLRDTLASIAATQKIVIVLKDNFVGLKSVSLSEKTLEVAVALEGTADLTVNAIPIPVK